jgi:hypothetical protein
VLAWFITGALVMPAVIGGCLLLMIIQQGNAAELMDSLPWMAFGLACAALGGVLAVLATQQTFEDNRKWKAFFNPERIAHWQDKGFTHDSKGLHGMMEGVPVSIHFELDARSEYAKAVVFASVSDEVEDLRKLGDRMGNSWFFLFGSYERLFDPPFRDQLIEQRIGEAIEFGRDHSFHFDPVNPMIGA